MKKQNLRYQSRPEGDPEEYDTKTILAEFSRCFENGVDSLIYFLRNYMMIQSNDAGKWVRFELWDTDAGEYHNQYDVVSEFATNRYVITLKARQMGITWISLGYCLWLAIFFAPQYSLFLSKGENEGKALKKRLGDILTKLPSWMKPELLVDNSLEIEFINESYFRFDNPRGGDSRTFNTVVVDEADLIYRSNTSLSQVILNVEPTIGTRGQMILISKSDKKKPSSTFKRIYRDGLLGKNRYKSLFVPWYVNPSRTEKWYEMQRDASLSVDGTLDTLHESYPDNPEEALRGKSANKRLPYYLMKTAESIEEPLAVIDHQLLDDEKLLNELNQRGCPIINGFVIYRYPELGHAYVMGADPSEGLADGDKVGLSIVDADSLEEVAQLNVTADPELFAQHIVAISKFYNQAPVLHENNNHGHALLVSLNNLEASIRILQGWTASGTGKKAGWNTNAATKTLMYDTVVQKAREKAMIIHSQDTFNQLLSIDSGTLKAPEGEEDDMAVAYALCVVATEFCAATFDMAFIKRG